MLKVPKVKKPGVGWIPSSASTGSLGSGGGSISDLQALCDGPAPPPAPPLGGGASSSSHDSCVLAVESLECSIAELRSLKVEIEAQTWSGRKPG